jgi:hypothetical protein
LRVPVSQRGRVQRHQLSPLGAGAFRCPFDVFQWVGLICQISRGRGRDKMEANRSARISRRLRTMIWETGKTNQHPWKVSRTKEQRKVTHGKGASPAEIIDSYCPLRPEGSGTCPSSRLTSPRSGQSHYPNTHTDRHTRRLPDLRLLINLG